MYKNIKKMKLIICGKAKKVYKTDSNNDLVIIEYTDNITAFNNNKKEVLKNKGKINCEITSILYSFLQKKRVNNHLIYKIDDQNILCKKLKMFPLEVIVRNYAKGSIVKNLGLKEYTKFSIPIIEFSYKNDSLNDPLISERQIIGMKIINKKTLKKIIKISLKINFLLSKLFIKSEISLLDFKIEFGYDKKNKIILGDELSPDCMRLENLNKLKKYDKDIYRENKGDVIEGYSGFLKVLKNVI